MKDYYQILGITRDASSEEIKKAYRKLAHQYHPDKGGDEMKFKEINEAYQTLSNREKRAQYDQFGRTFEGGQGFGQGFGDFDFGSFWQGSRDGSSGIDINIEDLFEDFFGLGKRGRRKDINRGRNIEVEMDWTENRVRENSIEKRQALWLFYKKRGIELFPVRGIYTYIEFSSAQ